MNLKRILDKSFISVFIVSVFVIGMIYGVFVYKEKLFPYNLLLEAGLAYHALSDVVSSGLLPASFKAYATDVQAGPNAIKMAAGGLADDWILVTGGPYEFLEECPHFGCLAWVVDRDGTVIYSWQTNLDALWRDVSHVEGFTDPASFKWLGTHLLDDGGLLVAFHNDRAFMGEI